MSLIANFSQTQVLYQVAGKRLGFVKRDYDTVWRDFLPNGEPVTIRNKSRGARNEILNGAVPGSSFGSSPGLPATEKFSGGKSVLMTRDFCRGFSAANWAVSRKYIAWDFFMKEVIRALRSAGFWSNNQSVDVHKIEFHTGDTYGNGDFGIKVSEMTMGASVVSIVDENSEDFVIEAIGADQVKVGGEFCDIHAYQYLWSVTSNSVRQEIKDAKGNRIGFEEHWFEPLLSGNIRIPTLGTFKTSASETGWAARIPKFRIEEVDVIPYPWILRDGRTPPSPFDD